MNTEQFVGFFSGLSSVNRFSQYRLLNPESVLEHSGMVALATLMLLDKLDIDCAHTRLEALEHALCHDVDEILTGDIPMPTKYANFEVTALINAVSEINAKRIDKKYDVEFLQHRQAQDHVKVIVKFADVLAVFYKCYQEIELFGNKSLISATESLAAAINNRFYDLKTTWAVTIPFTDFVEEAIVTVNSWRSK